MLADQLDQQARKLHARLENLGAKSFHRLGLGDDQHDFGAELSMRLCFRHDDYIPLFRHEL